MFSILISNNRVVGKPNGYVTLELKKAIWLPAISFESHEYKALDEFIKVDTNIHEKSKVTEIRKEYMVVIGLSQILKFSCPFRYMTSLSYY